MRGQRKQRADGERTREAIVREAVSLATVDGLEGLSIGNLAGALDMSKSGIYAHFGSKQDLQLATVEEAGRIFQAEVIEPALAAAPGLAQVVAVCDAFFDHLLRRTFPGGCFFAGAALEMGTRPGPVKEQIAAFQGGFGALIRQFIVTALEQHELPTDEDPDALTFELNGIILAANTNFVLRQDPAALNMARTIVRRRLGITTTTTPPPSTNRTKSKPSIKTRKEPTRQPPSAPTLRSRH
jgi:AcrR family transcriptional regulator